MDNSLFRNALICGVLFCFSLPVFSDGNIAAGKEERNNLLKNIDIGPGMLDVNASARLRGEHFTNRSLKRPGTGSDDEVLFSRMVLGLQYRFDFGVSFFAEVYDARMFFNEFGASDFTPSCPHENVFDLSRATIEYRFGGSDEVSDRLDVGVRAGRQRFTFADQRVWGEGMWGNSYKYRWDGVRTFFENRLISMDLLWGRRLQVEPSQFDNTYYNYDAVGCYLQNTFLKPITLDAFYVGKYRSGEVVVGENGAGPLAVTTLGVHGKGDLGIVTVEGTGAGQLGRYGEDNVVAGGLSVTAACPLKLPFKPQLSAGYTFGSGDGDPVDGTHGTFDGLFGSAAKYYGRMNLFYWMNLHDLEAGVTITPVKKSKLNLAYHYFMLASVTDAWYGTGGTPQKRSNGTPRRDKTGKSGGELAHEIDIVATVSLVPFTKIIAGFGYCIPGEFIRNTALDGTEKEPMTSLFLQAELVY